jgi:hypothetical protein
VGELRKRASKSRRRSSREAASLISTSATWKQVRTPEPNRWPRMGGIPMPVSHTSADMVSHVASLHAPPALAGLGRGRCLANLTFPHHSRQRLVTVLPERLRFVVGIVAADPAADPTLCIRVLCRQLAHCAEPVQAGEGLEDVARRHCGRSLASSKERTPDSVCDGTLRGSVCCGGPEASSRRWRSSSLRNRPSAAAGGCGWCSGYRPRG